MERVARRQKTCFKWWSLQNCGSYHKNRKICL